MKLNKIAGKETEMKKMAGVFSVMVILCSFLLLGSRRAEAMNNESAALLAGAVVLFGSPVIQAMTGGFYYPAYYPSRTRIVVIGDANRRYVGSDRACWRGRYDEQHKHDYRGSWKDEGRSFRRDRY
jgi:hypothetical protein